ncbi:hypothetical protein ACWC5I_00430 [Kitasatospora sp. NPDC001574]
MRDFTDREISVLRASYKAGKSLKTLAAGAGISATSLSVLFDGWGILKRRGRCKSPATPENNSTSQRPEVDVELAAKRYRAGESMIGLATSLGVAPPTLRGALRAHGVHIRNHLEAATVRWAAAKTP